MATFLICHGAWSAGWAWKKVRPLLRAAGHEVFTPTYTGLGERAHLVHPGIDLDAHIADVQAVLQYEDLRNVTLLGHSYGGMVATGVADRAAERMARLIYLDAFVPSDGQSLFSRCPRSARRAPAPKATAGCSHRTRRRPTPRPRISPGSPRAGAGSRSAPSPSRCRSKAPPPAYPAATSTAPASRRRTPSGRSRAGSAPIRPGRIARSMPATVRT